MTIYSRNFFAYVTDISKLKQDPAAFDEVLQDVNKTSKQKKTLLRGDLNERIEIILNR